MNAIEGNHIISDSPVNELFANSWKNIDEVKNIDNSLPGLYILAYSSKKLSGKPIKPKDVFYVGKSNAAKGVRGRLSQFMSACYGKKTHSAGMRFFKEHGGGESYKYTSNGKRLYFSSITFRCEVKKIDRTANDLIVMGEISFLEYKILAYLKYLTGNEPLLNKQ